METSRFAPNTAADGVERAFGAAWDVASATPGLRIGRFNAVWYRLRKQ